jgi:hypothetical protein
MIYHPCVANKVHSEHYYAYPEDIRNILKCLLIRNELTVIGPIVPVGVAVIYAVSG